MFPKPSRALFRARSEAEEEAIIIHFAIAPASTSADKVSEDPVVRQARIQTKGTCSSTSSKFIMVTISGIRPELVIGWVDVVSRLSTRRCRVVAASKRAFWSLERNPFTISEAISHDQTSL